MTIDIREYRVKDLRDSLETNALWRSGAIPITKHRAISQINNPRSDEDDVVLLIAYQDDEVVGYIGMLPDRFEIGDALHKIAWATAFWVSSRLRRQGIGTKLVAEALDRWDGSIAVFGNENTHRTFMASGNFVPLKTLQGAIGSFGIRTESLLRKVPRLSTVSPAIKFGVGIVNAVSDLRTWNWERRSRIYSKVSIEHVSEVDKEARVFMENHRGNELCKRGFAELNWIMKYPWILSSPVKDRMKSRYYFSSVTRRFSCHMIKIFGADKMIGFVMLVLVDGRLQIPYCYFGERDVGNVLIAIVHCGIRIDAFELESYNEQLVKCLLTSGIPYLHARERVMKSLVSRKYEHVDFGGNVFQDGDGDLAFW